MDYVHNIVVWNQYNAVNVTKLYLSLSQRFTERIISLSMVSWSFYHQCNANAVLIYTKCFKMFYSGNHGLVRLGRIYAWHMF